MAGRYGTFKYGDTTYGAPYMPLEWQAVLMDETGANVKILDNHIVEDIQWSFLRYGGCGQCSVKVRNDFLESSLVGAEYRFALYCNTEETAKPEKVYEGFVVDKAPSLTDPDILDLRFNGFWSQARRIIVGKTVPYERTAATIKEIVADILQTYVTPATDILYDEQFVDEVFDTDGVTLYRPDYIQFAQDAMACIEYLARIAGDYIYGVDKNRTFYFRAPSTSIDFCYWPGNQNLLSYKPLESYENIVNRCIVKTRWYSLAFERDDDLAISEEQDTQGGDIIVGNTVYQKVKQTFTTDKKSISKIRLAVGPASGGVVQSVNDSKFCGVGFQELVKDGDFSRGDYTFWNTYRTGTTIELLSDPSGNSYLAVEPLVAGGGCYQDVYGCGAGDYTLRVNYALQRGDFKMIVIGVQGSTETELLSTERITAQTKGKSFQTEEATFTVDQVYDYVRVYFVSDYIFVSKFFIDNASLTVIAGGLRFMLIDNTTGAELLEQWVEKSVQDLPLAGQSNEFDVDINYYGCDSGTTYAIVIERTGNPSNDNYFKLMTGTDYVDGTASYHNGTAWVSVHPADLFFKTYYNQSQESYKLHEELISTPPTTDIDLLKKYINGYLATKDRPTKRAMLQLAGVRRMLDADMPGTPLGMLSVRAGETIIADIESLHIQNIVYTITDTGIFADVNAGERLPDIGRMFARTQHDIQNQISTWGN